MKKLRVLSVVGTRPEIIRLSRVVSALDRHTEHILVHTGQNYDYELNGVFFEDLELRKPDYFLEAAAGSAGETIGNIISRVDATLGKVSPDAMLVLGDTNSCLSVIPAKRRRIPIFHMEAGNRCFDDRVPEETNRKIVDHVADINMPYSDIAREYLLREGIPADRIVKTGSPMYEVLTYYGRKIEASDILARLGLTPGRYFVVSSHREENIDSDSLFPRLVDALNRVAEQFRWPVILSTHPRTRRKIEETGASFHALVSLMKPLGFLDYICLQKSAYAVLSDSGTITEESSVLGFPALNIREAHERPEGMEEATVMMTGLSAARIIQALNVLHPDGRPDHWRPPIVKDYDVPIVSEKVVRIILSYTDYVRRKVWQME